ncbi:MAG: GNAT family protein [Rhodanobacter sp.]
MASEELDDAIELGDARVRLRPWRSDDAAALVEAVRESIETVGRWLPWCHAGYGIEEAATWIAHCRSGWQAGDHFALAIFDATSGRLLGGAGLSQLVAVHRHANLGYWIRQSGQRQGAATDAAQLVARFGFERLGLLRIEIVVLPENRASRATAEKIGARFESIARHRLLLPDGARDAAVYGLIAQDLG